MRIIFLDIDGPMIPVRAFVSNRHASIEQDLDPGSVKALRAIVTATEAKIVFNTTHNRMLPSLLDRFAAVGFLRTFDIHDDCHTLYPDLDRLTAIREWLHRHPEVEHWVAFDDAKIEDERAFLTSFEHGIGFGEYEHARRHLLGLETGSVLI